MHLEVWQLQWLWQRSLLKLRQTFQRVYASFYLIKFSHFRWKRLIIFQTSSLVTRSTNDVNQVQMFIVMGLQMLIKAPILAGWALMKIMDKSWQWTLSTGVAVIALLVIVGVCVLIALPKFKRVQKLTDNLNRIARENITGLRVVRAYNAEDYQEDKFEIANKELTSTNLFTNSVLAFLNAKY